MSDSREYTSEVWMFGVRGNTLAAEENVERCSTAGVLEREVVDLYDEHAAALHRFASASGASASLAQDAVQEAFLRYFLSRSGGNRVAEPKAWLFQFVHEYVGNRVAENDAESKIRLPADNLPADVWDTPPEGRWEEKAENLARLLTPREKECLRLRAEGMSYRDIADVLNISMGNVSAKLSRAVRKLQIHLWRVNG